MDLLGAAHDSFSKDTYNIFKKRLDEAKNERDILQYLNANIYLFNVLDHAWNGKYGKANFQFGSDYIADFIILSAHSGAWIIRLIEAQSPTDTIYTKQYNETKGLREARRQISEWKQWVNSHQQQFRESLATVVDDDAPAYCSNASLHRRAKTELVDLATPVRIEYSALIGRREFRDTKKNQLANVNYDFDIITYDRLLDWAKSVSTAMSEKEC